MSGRGRPSNATENSCFQINVLSMNSENIENIEKDENYNELREF